MNAECQRFLGNLDLELEPAEAAWQEAHRTGCAACAAEAETRERIRSALRRAVRAVPVTPELENSIRTARRRPYISRRWHGYAAAAAVFILAGAFLAAPYITVFLEETAYYAALPETVSRIMRVGLADHVHCAAFRKFRKPPVATDLPAPFRPVLRHVPPGFGVQAAHECKAQGRNFIHLVLRSPEGKTVSLVMARKSAGETFANSPLRRVLGGLPVFTEDVPHYRIAGFEADSFLVFVVSDMSAADNQQLALSLAAPVVALLNTIA